MPATVAWLTVVGVILGLAGLGAMHRQSSRPPAMKSVADIAAKFNALPMRIAGWSGTPMTIDAKQLRTTEALASLSRSYHDAQQAVVVLLLYGPPGPLGAHTPEVCYPGNGYRPLGEPYRIGGEELGGELWASRFESPGIPPETVEVLWAWGTGDRWLAASNPRLHFAGLAGIYKLYITRKIPQVAEDSGPPAAFLQAFFRECRILLADTHSCQ